MVCETRVDQEKPCDSRPGAISITVKRRIWSVFEKMDSGGVLSVILLAPGLLPQGLRRSVVVSQTSLHGTMTYQYLLRSIELFRIRI